MESAGLFVCLLQVCHLMCKFEVQILKLHTAFFLAVQTLLDWVKTVITVIMRSLCEIGGDYFGPNRGTKTITDGFTQWPKVIIFINNHYFCHICIYVQVYYFVKMWITLKYKKLGINLVFPHILNLYFCTLIVILENEAFIKFALNYKQIKNFGDLSCLTWYRLFIPKITPLSSEAGQLKMRKDGGNKNLFPSFWEVA